MTNEQIKQNAEEYASTKEMHSPRSQDVELDKLMIIEDYIAGAHSRDEEVEQLKKAISSAQKAMAELAEIARHPWISVKERLPEEDTVDKGYSVEVIGLFSDDSVSDCFCSIEENIWFILGAPCDRPTHWMPKPELKKGE